jgi:peptidoglycan-N-acetylglucosamine deacetylase
VTSLEERLPMRESPLPAALQGTVTLSVDVEDWHQLVTRRWTGETPECSPHVESQVARVLDVLDRHGARATFFVLGAVSRAKPALVRRIADAGHEIASHGISHTPLHLLDRAAVRAELRDSREQLRDIAGVDVVGFRAPEFSIQKRNLWVLEEIAAAGYRYDSSIFPIAHRRYGIRDFARSPVQIRFDSGTSLWELPLATLGTRFGNLPIAGGGYFRVLPGRILARTIGSVARRGELAMLYFHPYEFATRELSVSREMLPEGMAPRLKARTWFALQALGRSRLPGKLERIVSSSHFARAIDIVDALAADRTNVPRTTENQEYS